MRHFGSAMKYSKNNRKTNETYLSELKEKGFNIRPLEPYSKARTKLPHECLDCGHQWSVSPNTVLTMYIHGCPACATRKTAENNIAYKSTSDYAIALAKHRSDVIPTGDYIANYKRSEHRCLNCGNLYMTMPSYLLCRSPEDSNKCPHCPNLRPRIVKSVRIETIDGKKFKYKAMKIEPSK